MSEPLQQGQWESSGEFTLDSEAAVSKSGLILADPLDYPLKLIQWAVASQPTLVMVEVGRRSTRVSHDGRSVDPSQMARAVLNPLAVGDRALRHLAIGYQAALKLKPTSIWLDHPQGRWEALTQQDHPASPSTGTTALTLEGIPAKSGFPPEFTSLPAGRTCQQSPLFTWLQGLSKIYAAELIRQRCRLAGVPILLNGVALNTPRETRSSFKRGEVHFNVDEQVPDFYRYRYLLADSAPAALLAPPLGHRDRTEWLMVSPLQRDPRPLQPAAVAGTSLDGKPMLACQAAILITPKVFRGYRFDHSVGEVGWVSDGVTLELEAVAGMAGSAYADAGDMPTDLSGLKMVHDHTYQERLQWLQHWTHVELASTGNCPSEGS